MNPFDYSRAGSVADALAAGLQVDQHVRHIDEDDAGCLVTMPAAAVAWKIHQEPFLAGSRALTQLKLRFSYGATGNEGINPSESLGVADDTVVVFSFTDRASLDRWLESPERAELLSRIDPLVDGEPGRAGALHGAQRLE